MPIKTAFLVCAGLGTRMKPLTDNCPKPLLALNGRPLLDYIIDHLRQTHVCQLTINSHYLPEQISDYARTIKDFAISLSYEPVLLETGGGLVQALDTLGQDPFFMINGDAFWQDAKGHSTLNEIESHFRPEDMDILLCLTPVSNMHLTEGVGDYDLLPDGKVCRNQEKKGTHMFTGIRILNPDIMKGFNAEKFSFLRNMDDAQQKGRLYGFVMEGDWHHISTPDDLKNVEQHIKINQHRDGA